MWRSVRCGVPALAAMWESGPVARFRSIGASADTPERTALPRSRPGHRGPRAAAHLHRGKRAAPSLAGAIRFPRIPFASEAPSLLSQQSMSRSKSTKSNHVRPARDKLACLAPFRSPEITSPFARAVALAMLLSAAAPSPASACGISGDTGSYKATCTNCSIAGTILSCDCLNKQHVRVHTSIDLTDCRLLTPDDPDPLSNNDGQLFCHHCSVHGACCLPDTHCTVRTFNESGALGGTFLDDAPCPDFGCGATTQLRRTNAAGRAFPSPSNWDPAEVPGSTDTAVFDLGLSSHVVVSASNDTVERIVIDGMGVDLAGSARVVGTTSPTFSLDISNGGSLDLLQGSTFVSQAANVGSGSGPESTVVVNSGSQ